MMGNKTTYYYSCGEDLTPLFDATHLAVDPTVTFVLMAEMDCVAKVFKIVSYGWFMFCKIHFAVHLKGKERITFL